MLQPILPYLWALGSSWKHLSLMFWDFTSVFFWCTVVHSSRWPFQSEKSCVFSGEVSSVFSNVSLKFLWVNGGPLELTPSICLFKFLSPYFSSPLVSLFKELFLALLLATLYFNSQLLYFLNSVQFSHSVVRLHPSTAFWTLQLTMMATPFLLRDSFPQ